MDDDFLTVAMGLDCFILTYVVYVSPNAHMIFCYVQLCRKTKRDLNY
jgi:hypothetical protein